MLEENEEVEKEEEDNMAYKLGKERRQIRNSSTTPIFQKKLGKNILAEANNDGTIFISNEIPEGSPLEKKVIKHEAKHMVDMKTGKLGYDDNHIKWNGKKYARKDGKINYKGKWIPEGSKDFPWEKH